MGGGGGRAGGGGGGALDRVEEGRGPADCTDGGDGGVCASALLGHARQAKVRQPRLAARVEEDVARLDLQVINARMWWRWRCRCLWRGFPMSVNSACHLYVLMATPSLGAAIYYALHVPTCNRLSP